LLGFSPELSWAAAEPCESNMSCRVPAAALVGVWAGCADAGVGGYECGAAAGGAAAAAGR
jgi:hypothetical protein